jgi:hypothetical protein
VEGGTPVASSNADKNQKIIANIMKINENLSSANGTKWHQMAPNGTFIIYVNNINKLSCKYNGPPMRA